MITTAKKSTNTKKSTSTNSKLSRLAINDEGFAFDPATGDAYLLNPAGLAVVRSLQAREDEAGLAETLSAEYDISREDVARDVCDFLTRLRSLKLL